MKQNVCGVDRWLRIVAGVALLAVALGLQNPEERRRVSLARVLAGYGAAEFLLINGTLQWCPLNYAVGFDSCDGD